MVKDGELVAIYLHGHGITHLSLGDLVAQVDAFALAKSDTPIRRNIFSVEHQENIALLEDARGRATVDYPGDQNATVAACAQSQ